MEIKMFKREYLHPNPRTTIFGKTGSGKTIFVRKLLSYYNSNFRIVVIDTKKEEAYSDIPLLKVEDFAFKTFIRRVSSIKRPDGILITDIGQVMEIIAGLLLQFNHTILVIEEIPSIIAKHAELYRSFPNTARTLMQGRATYNGIISIGQAPADTHLSFIKQVDDLYCFRCMPVEEDTISKICGVNIPFNEIPLYENKKTGNKYGGFYSLRHNVIFDKVTLPGHAGRPSTKKENLEKSTGELKDEQTESSE